MRGSCLRQWLDTISISSGYDIYFCAVDLLRLSLRHMIVNGIFSSLRFSCAVDSQLLSRLWVEGERASILLVCASARPSLVVMCE